MVDRCVCEDTTFSELIAIARAEGLDFDTLTERTGCALRCGLCEPYIREALQTGRSAMAAGGDADHGSAG